VRYPCFLNAGAGVCATSCCRDRRYSRDDRDRFVRNIVLGPIHLHGVPGPSRHGCQAFVRPAQRLDHGYHHRTNLSGASAVNFGSVAASTFTVNSDTQITATAPAEAVGTVDVTVTTPTGTSTTGASDHY